MRKLVALFALLFAFPAYARTGSVVGVVLDATATADTRAQQKFTIPAGENGEIDITVKRFDGTAYDLTGCTLVFTVKSNSSTTLISREATINNPPTLGTAFFPLVPADTVSILPGNYSYDIWITLPDLVTRYQVVPASWFTVSPGLGQPGQPVTVPASQQPLAQGPAGPTGPTGPAGASGPTGPAGQNAVAPPSYDSQAVSVGGVQVWRQVEEVDATFDGTSALATVTWPTFSTRSFEVYLGSPSSTATESIGAQVVASSVTAIGCQIQASDKFTGTVPVIIQEVLSPSVSGEVVATNGTARTRQIAEVVATFSSAGSAQVSITWPDFGAKQFYVSVSHPSTDAASAISVQVVSSSVTSTGCTLQASAPFTGTVVVIAKEKLS